MVTDAHYAFVSSIDGGKTWSAPKKIVNDTSLLDVDPNAPNDATLAPKQLTGTQRAPARRKTAR